MVGCIHGMCIYNVSFSGLLALLVGLLKLFVMPYTTWGHWCRFVCVSVCVSVCVECECVCVCVCV